MFRLCLQLICLPCILLASTQIDLTGRWDWIKSYRGGFAGGWVTPGDLGYPIHMSIRNDSVFTFHGDTLMQSDSVKSLVQAGWGTTFVMRSDTLIIEETAVEAVPASYWKKAHSTIPLSDKPPVLFLNSVINYAWDYRHSGWLIDSSGAIRTYAFTKSDSVGYIRQTDTFPSKMYDQLLSHSTLTTKKIPLDTLRSKMTLIESASSGILSLSGACADAGIYRYSAFLYDTYTSRPKEIICFQMGDEWICNSSSAAKKIARWLNSIDSVNLRLCAPPDSCLNFATSIIKDGVSSQGKNAAFIPTDNKVINVGLAKSGTIVIRAYTLRGELLVKPFERFLTAGEHRIYLAHMFTGIQSKKPLIVEISMGGVRLETRTAIISHR
jgi:hypothetical protein